MSCPICDIPNKEKLLYNDDLVFLVNTIDDKGHLVRVMSCTHRHTKEPTFEEELRCTTVLYDYMISIRHNQPWYVVDSTHCSIPDHYHRVACSGDSNDPKEIELFNNTPKVEFPIHGNVMIGIPAHQEEDHIIQVVLNAKKHGDVVVYCDGCTDKTPYYASSAGAYIINGHPNLGYGGALDKLFDHARQYDYDKLVILDGDGQHDPTQIPQFLLALRESDIVIGNRFLGSHDTPIHRQVIIKTINTILGVGDSQCGFRAYNRKAINTMKLSDYSMSASLEVLNIARSNDLRLSEVPCNIVYADTEHSTPTLTHGKNLIETVMWTLLWRNTFLVLIVPALLALGYAGYSLLKMLYIYQVEDTFSIGLGIIGVGALSVGLILLLFSIIIMVAKRQIMELKRR